MKPEFEHPATPSPVQRKVFDVMRPGRAQPNSTSKPVIVGHRPVVSDPSVTMNGIGARPMMNPHKKIAIMSHDDSSTPVPAVPAPVALPAPLTTPIPPAAPSTVPASPHTAALTPALVAAATAATPVPPSSPKPSVMPWALPSTTPVQPSTPPPSTSHASSAPAIPIDITAEESAVPDDDLLATMPAPSAEEPHAAPTVSQQVGPKTFPWKIVVPIAIIVTLAVVIVDILLDADFISWGVPHTHFF